jgi:hypothetical protein
VESSIKSDVKRSEKAKLVDATSRKDRLSIEVTSARAKVQALYFPGELLAAIKAGYPELRLKLKSEIARRVTRIDILFDGKIPTGTTITLINGYKNFLLFQKER